MLYQVCDFTLSSNLPFPELRSLAGGTPTCSFTLGHQPVPAEPVTWFHRWHTPNNAVWLLFGRLADRYVLRFPHLADFVLSGDGLHVICTPQEFTPPATIRHLFLDQVVPLMLNAQGRLAFHASAVALPEGAIGFAGITGYGKSTLAAHFAASGDALLTDDCLLVEQHNDRFAAVPSYPSVRLWHDSIAQLDLAQRKLDQVAHYSSKQRWNLDSVQPNTDAARLLQRIYFLSSPDARGTTIDIQPLQTRDAYLELMTYAFTLDTAHQARMAQQCAVLARIAAAGLCYRLSFPRDYAQLPFVREAVIDHVRATAHAHSA